MLTFQTDFQSERIAVDEDRRDAVNDTYVLGTYLCCCCTIYLYLVRNIHRL